MKKQSKISILSVKTDSMQVWTNYIFLGIIVKCRKE